MRTAAACCRVTRRLVSDNTGDLTDAFPATTSAYQHFGAATCYAHSGGDARISSQQVTAHELRVGQRSATCRPVEVSAAGLAISVHELYERSALLPFVAGLSMYWLVRAKIYLACTCDSSW